MRSLGQANIVKKEKLAYVEIDKTDQISDTGCVE